MQGEWISLIMSDGHAMPCYHVTPKGERRGGLVLVQEIFGVTDTKEGSAAERGWLRALEKGNPIPRPELEEHAGAPDRVLAIMRALMEGIA